VLSATPKEISNDFKSSSIKLPILNKLKQKTIFNQQVTATLAELKWRGLG